MRVAMHLATLTLIVSGLIVGSGPAEAAPTFQPSAPVTSAIAYQPFEHGYMLWREDVDKITVAYTDIPTKSGGSCSEVYRDTFDGQPYEIPAPPPGLTVPQLGFGWLYANDPEMARRLGYATSEEVSRVAEITPLTIGGGRAISVVPTEPLPGVEGRLVPADPEEPGLTYCFTRRSENRDATNTWVSRQLFEHGAMVWRQDMFDRVEVWHNDTLLAPEIICGDTLMDTWKPGMPLAYGDLAEPGKRLPVRGFGKAWLDNPYVRTSLGYPTSDEQGGFAELNYEPFQHPVRGNLLIRHMTVHLPDGQDWTTNVTIPSATSPADDRTLSRGCQAILIPHQH